MGGMTFALTAVQAVSSIGKGYAQQAEAGYNASLLEGKAGLIDVQKGIEKRQYERLKRRTLSKSMANLAASGLRPTGSPMAVMMDTLTQINLDQAIGQFNFEQQKRYTQAEADTFKRKGKMAVRAGYGNALSSLMQGAATYAEYQGTFDKKE